MAPKMDQKVQDLATKNPWKIDERIDAEIDAEKVMKSDEKSMQNCPEIDLNFDTFRKLVSWKVDFSEKGEPTQTTIFMQ